MTVTHATVSETIDGVVYSFSPLTVEDLEYLELWLRARAIEAGRMSIPKGATPAEESRFMAPIIEHANRISLFSSEGFNQLITPSSIIPLIHRMVVKNHPKLTTNDCMQWLQTPGVLSSLMSKLAMLFPGNSGGTPNTATKNSAHPSRKKHSSRR